MRSSNEPNEEGTGKMSDDYEARYASAVNRHARAAKSRLAAAKIAEPLLAGMAKAGEYRYSPKEYQALARYHYDYQPDQARKALTEGRFKFGPFEFVRDKSLTVGPTTTIAEFARSTGTPKRTVAWRIAQTNLRAKMVVKRKHYYIADLEVIFALAVRSDGIMDEGTAHGGNAASGLFFSAALGRQKPAASGR